MHDVSVGADFSGVIRVDHDDETVFEQSYGAADRARGIPNTVDTQFAIASGGKGLTAVAVVQLIEAGALEWSTTARAVLGRDLPLIDDRVTVEHLLAHRSGIGDYLDEAGDHTITSYPLSVPVHQLATTEGFLQVLDGRPNVFAPGTQFAYCNSGYVLLALITERVSGVPYHDLVVDRVCAVAGMPDTRFLRLDEPTSRAAVGYLDADGARTNVLHLPVRGNGDGGVFTTLADMHSFWRAFFANRLTTSAHRADMVRARSIGPAAMRYGLGFWRYPTGDAVMLEGYDPGVSFRSVHDPGTGTTYTVISNWSDGAWPVVRDLDRRFGLRS
jgi:CubicO group peptidase (beta-lactamase class C family)